MLSVPFATEFLIGFILSAYPTVMSLSFFFVIHIINDLSSVLYVPQLKYSHVDLSISEIIAIFVIDNI